ncbi:hypothetical protein [Paenisporosarcina cavernae]|uniref:hypothetical protein n=1 Tax=Paenisporosarcina cavernae TaxID=2320858 RepID=UPI0013C3EBA3|nr:hypothetical protein [Paenisporosarcina cavernae]
MKSKSYLVVLTSLVILMVTANSGFHTDSKTVIYGLSALGIVLGGYLSVKKPKVTKEV